MHMRVLWAVASSLTGLGLWAGCSLPAVSPLAASAGPTETTLADAALTPPKPSTCAAVARPDQSGRLPPLQVPFDPAPVDIEREGKLQAFYDALLGLTDKKREGHVRVAVFGDSNLTMDFTTGRMRRQMSKIFGEGGHGFVALGKPWSHYRHMDVEHDVISGWQAYAMTTSPIGDGLYGLGGIAVEALYPGGKTWAKTAKPDAPVGQSASRFGVFYLKRPGGGRFKMQLDGAQEKEVLTASPEIALGFEETTAPEGAHRLDVIHAWGPTRVFGAVLEREAPGVVIDSFGVGSMNTKTMGRHNGHIFRSMVAARGYELVVFLLGANDLFTMDAVPETMRTLIGWINEARPSAAVLMVAPPDRGFRQSMPETLKVVEQREALARELDVAYWDQFRAMGGVGSMRAFVEQKLAFKDAVHYTEQGGAFVGDRFVDAILRGVERRALAKETACASGEMTSDQRTTAVGHSASPSQP